MSNNVPSAENGAASPAAAASASKAKRNAHLTVVEDAIVQAVGNAVGTAPTPAPSPAPASTSEVSKIPAVDPLSEYLAFETRRRLDAAAEIDLIDITMEQRKLTYDALLSKLENEYRRVVDDETNRFSAEWTSFEEQRRNQALILAGAEAALKAIGVGASRAATG